jgi:hypothetical protein
MSDGDTKTNVYTSQKEPLTGFALNRLCHERYFGLLVETRARIFKLLKSPGIDSKEPIPSAYEAWRAGTITPFLLGS